MAFYENAKLVKITGKPLQYQKVRETGEVPPAPGIYRCETCGFEDVMNRECQKLPPCSSCSKEKGANTWRFLVKATDA